MLQTPDPDWYRHPGLRELAKKAAEGAGRNAGVAPQLLMADIVFALVDAAEAGKIAFPQHRVQVENWDQTWDRFDERQNEMKAVTEEELIERSQFPRVTKDEMLANIKEETFFQHGLLTLCVLTLQNGFTVVGESACAVPGNFKKDVGQRLARGDAEGKVWALMGYELKTKVSMVLNGRPPSTPDLKTYVGQKVIHAKPMSRGEYNEYRGWDMPVGENPSDQGYLVEYADSDAYQSWSPKAVFEAAYQMIDVFGEGSTIPPTEATTDEAVPPSTSEASATWEDRLRKEEAEVKERLDKLEAFIGGELFHSLPDRDQRLMVEQKEAMWSYHTILVARLVGIS